MENYIFYATGVFFTLGALITVHFCLVLFTYWQEAAEKGETSSPGAEEEEALIEKD